MFELISSLVLLYEELFIPEISKCTSINNIFNSSWLYIIYYIFIFNYSFFQLYSKLTPFISTWLFQNEILKMLFILVVYFMNVHHQIIYYIFSYKLSYIIWFRKTEYYRNNKKWW